MKLNELLSEWLTVHREEEIKPQTIIRYWKLQVWQEKGPTDEVLVLNQETE